MTVGVPRKKQGHQITFGCMDLGDQVGELLAERRGSRQGYIVSVVFFCMRCISQPSRWISCTSGAQITAVGWRDGVGREV